MPTALAISPHLDDVVFSAGGTLARLARAEWRVIVATTFTASVPDPQGFALACQLDKGLAADIDYMALRRDEDAAACACLGAKTRWLPFVEAPHRGYRSATALFADPSPEDDIVARLAPALRALIAEIEPDLVLAPQAVGAHVDHGAVVMALAGCDRPIRWWLDHPYAARPSPRPSPFLSRLESLAAETVELDDAELDAKLDAVAAYRSQLGFQYGGLDAARAQVSEIGRLESFRVEAAQ